MNLEQKLSLIIEDIQEYKSDEPLRVGDFTFIEQIKKAFADAHYYQVLPQTKMIIFKQDDGTMKELRTGDLWYEGFKRLADSVHIYNLDHDSEYQQTRVMQQLYKAARKASGIKEQ